MGWTQRDQEERAPARTSRIPPSDRVQGLTSLLGAPRGGSVPRAGPGLTHYQGTPSSLTTSHSPTQTPGAPLSDNRFPEALLLTPRPALLPRLQSPSKLVTTAHSESSSKE